MSSASLRGLLALSDSFRADPRVRDVRSPVDLGDSRSILTLSAFYSELDSARAEYGEFLDSYLSSDTRVALLDVIPSDTTSLTSTMDLVERIREINASPPRQLRDATIRVGGYTASALDFQDDMMERSNAMWETDSPEGPSEAQMKEVQDLERDTAVADHACQEEVEYEKTYQDVQFDLEKAFVEEHRATLETIRELVSEAQE